MDIDIDFTPPPRSNQSKKSSRGFDWRSSQEYHSKRALEVAERFFEELDLSNTTEEQDDILYYSCRYGTYESSGMTTDELTAGFHMHEFLALEDIESDEGFVEEVILEVMQNGLMNRSGFISLPARKWRGKYLYKHVEKILDEKPDEFEKTSSELIDIWIQNIETYDYPTYVWYNGRKTIRELFSEIDPQEKRTETHGGESYTFREFWNYYKRDMNYSSQEVFDVWNRSYIDWTGILSGGRRKKRYLTLKRYRR